jgi:hypothetical protein
VVVVVVVVAVFLWMILVATLAPVRMVVRKMRRSAAPVYRAGRMARQIADYVNSGRF